MTAVVLSLGIFLLGSQCYIPIKPKAGICPNQQSPCAEGTYIPPTPADTLKAQRRADALIKKAIDEGRLLPWRGTINYELFPDVEYVDCFFWVKNAVWAEEGKQVQGSACAAGMTLYEQKTIKVALQEPDRVLPLVEWEHINYRLMQIGRTDLVDLWQSTGVDPKVEVK